MNEPSESREALAAFVESWGSMGLLWGVNKSIARVHALLIANEEPLTLDDVAQRLEISRGNASMSLKELRSWSDVWRMFFNIMRERKRREFDPALEAVRQALKGAEPGAGGKVQARLEQMVDLLSTMDRLARRLLVDEGASRATLRFLTGTVLGIGK